MNEELTPLRKLDPIGSPFTQKEKEFLEGQFLSDAYVIDPEVREAAQNTITSLQDKYPEAVYFLTLAGGQANGSFVLRKLQNPKVASDIDLYVGGMGADRKTLNKVTTDIRKDLQPTRLGLDGVLNGEKEDRYLNVSDVPGHIKAGDFDLLALPFQCSFGKVKEAQGIVLRHVIESEDKDTVWIEIREYHRQSLLLQNGQWSEEFNNAIQRQYQERKFELFSLPTSPEEALHKIESRS